MDIVNILKSEVGHAIQESPTYDNIIIFTSDEIKKLYEYSLTKNDNIAVLSRSNSVADVKHVMTQAEFYDTQKADSTGKAECAVDITDYSSW